MRRIGIMFFLFSMCFVTAAIGQSPKQAGVTSNQSLVLYDNFNGMSIDPTKWSDLSNTYLVREMVRELSPAYQGEGNNRRLRISDRAYSDTYSDFGGVYGWLALGFTHPASIREVSFTEAVNAATLTNCSSNPDFESNTWGGFTGRFFNYGDRTDPNQDVSADILLYPTSKTSGPFYVIASVKSADGIINQSEVLGTVNLRQTVKLHLKWDQANRQFVFQLNKDRTVSIGYSASDSFPPFYEVKELYVGHGTPQCTSNPLGNATIDAYFDDVYVNPQ